MRKKTIERSIEIHRATYNTEAGKFTLATLLDRAGLFKPIKNEEQRVLHNMAVSILDDLGVTRGINYGKLVNAILRLSVTGQEDAVQASAESSIGWKGAE